jgi:hypothetical protein
VPGDYDRAAAIDAFRLAIGSRYGLCPAAPDGKKSPPASTQSVAMKWVGARIAGRCGIDSFDTLLLSEGLKGFFRPPVRLGPPCQGPIQSQQDTSYFGGQERMALAWLSAARRAKIAQGSGTGD